MLKDDLIRENEFTALCKKYPVSENKNIRDKLLCEIKEWKDGLRMWLCKDNPFNDHARALKIAKHELESDEPSIERIENDLFLFKSLASSVEQGFNEKYWLSEISKLKNKPKLDLLVKKFSSKKTVKKSKADNTDKDNRLICRTLLQQQWQKLLEQNQAEWELNKINEYRRQLLKKLSEWLELMQQLDDVLSELSIEPGLFLDLSKGGLSFSDIDQLKRWCVYISNDEGVKNLCDIMGRLRQEKKSKRQELVKQISLVNEFVPDMNSKEEIVGIHLGRDIERALPQELALMADDETSVLFDMKFVEGRLMCFDMEGRQQIEGHIEEEILVEVEDKEQLGPIIICVDTSGSMQGTPETIAKAVTLFMATRAISQNRKCCLINFSTGIEKLDLSGDIGMLKVFEFLKRSFHGGTDAAPALMYALELMGNEDYKKADLLMISDFIMATLPINVQDKINFAKQNKNKFYSLSIGNIFLDQRLRSIFYNEWVYNPQNSSVHSIQDMVCSI